MSAQHEEADSDQRVYNAAGHCGCTSGYLLGVAVFYGKAVQAELFGSNACAGSTAREAEALVRVLVPARVSSQGGDRPSHRKQEIYYQRKHPGMSSVAAAIVRCLGVATTHDKARQGWHL